METGVLLSALADSQRTATQLRDENAAPTNLTSRRAADNRECAAPADFADFDCEPMPTHFRAPFELVRHCHGYQLDYLR